mmetsp:Transcript_34424/g.79470  ORF Transcript_34424/g.79470 Transcript_34424/m.79470 type:complete len:277 (+) Transcript_34424:483-1313(+)
MHKSCGPELQYQELFHTVGSAQTIINITDKKTSLSSVGSDSLQTCIQVGSLEISLMNPCIGTIFDAPFYRKRLMMGLGIPFIGVVIHDGWPDQGPSSFGHDGQVQSRKVGSTTGLDIVEIEKHRQETSTLLSIDLMANKVMMRLVELTDFIAQHLQIFGILFWCVGQIGNAIDHGFCVRIFVTIVLAPSIGGGSPTVDFRIVGPIKLEFPHVGTAFVSLLGTQFDQTFGFFLRKKVIQDHDPWSNLVFGRFLGVVVGIFRSRQDRVGVLESLDEFR